MNPFEKLVSELKRLHTGYREESYYRSLCDFLESYASGREYLHMINISATSNPNSESIGEGVGFPDIEVRRNRRLIGYIEVKAPNENLSNPVYITQFNKYKESLENVIFTNFKHWTLYTWDKDGKPQKTAEAVWDFQQDLIAEQLKKLLTVFFEGQSYQAKTPHQLAITLARKTKLLSQQAEEALIAECPDKKLVDLKKTFEKTLIKDISDHQFANIYAETIAYSLFLAKLEHSNKGSNVEFTLRTAVDFLPKNVPILRDLYQLTGGRVEPITPGIYKATEIIIEQLNFADIGRIHKKLVEHKPGEDPVIQFYEPFLGEYDPEEKKDRGVFYTPKPVVDYIVRSVDFVLKNKFNKSKGLGDLSVQILDPAAGTGTFLQSVIQNIYSDIEKKNKPLGEQAVKREFDNVVSSHILKHIYGFELLVAPYAVAHLKLTLELERLGFNFSMTEKDQDKENDRLKIYLANTLDDPNQPPQNLFGFESITEESERARLVKKNELILAIIGNPPYSKSSSNRNGWIENLMEDYKVNVRKTESQIQGLSNDYIKFIRFAQWKIHDMKNGVIGLITGSGYLEGPQAKDMRNLLLKDFNQIYILNLHGSLLRTITKEKDESVFPIKLGTAVIIAIKGNPSPCEVKYFEVIGSKRKKFDFLLENDISTLKWENILITSENNEFIPSRNKKLSDEYANCTDLTEIFGTGRREIDKEKRWATGFATQQDEFAISFSEDEMINKINTFLELGSNESLLRSKYKLCTTDQWNFQKALEFLRNKSHLEFERKISYRPFDNRTTIFHKNVVTITRSEVMNNLFSPNLALDVSRACNDLEFAHIFTTIFPTDKIFLSSKSSTNCYVFPLYRLNNNHDSPQLGLNGYENKKEPNLSSDFIKKFSTLLSLNFINLGKGDLINTYGPEDLYCYIYAILFSPTYRSRYYEQLKKDFPRLPLTSNKALFNKLVLLGNELVNLHLVGENPFDKSKTVFDDTSKWHVKIGGGKPDDVDDWKVVEVRYVEKMKRLYVNSGQYIEGIEKDVWDFKIGGYQILDKWLKDRKNAGRILSQDDSIHYMKIIVSLRETIRIMKEIDQAIPEWPIK